MDQSNNQDLKIQLFEKNKINILAEAKSHYSTGIEIEVIHAVVISATTIYDMLKSYKKKIVIKNIQLIEIQVEQKNKKKDIFEAISIISNILLQNYIL